MELIEYDQSILSFDVEYHPLSLLFPPMPSDEFDKFKEDIFGNGVNNPIYYVIDNKKILILDGRHRYKACTELGIDPFQYMVPFDGPGSDHSFVLSQIKFTRLHLFDWIVIGGASKSNNTPEWTPPFDWIVDLHNQARLAGCKIYHKDNLGFNESMRLKEFPWTDSKEKELPESFKYLKGM